MVYQIGDFYVDYPDSNFPLVNDEFMDKFRVLEEVLQSEDIKKEDIIRFKTSYKDLTNISKCKQLHYSSLSEIYETEEGKMLIYHWCRSRYGIGYWMKDLDEEEIVCYFNPQMHEQLPVTGNWFFSICGLHRALLRREAPVLHASYIDWNGKAILFSAPSQTGKSTQARLWETYEQTEIINDDRVLLRKKDGVWNAYGYPSCGSSKICINRTLPIAALVILEQGKENIVREMTLGEKVTALFSGIEIYTWDEEEVNMSIQTATRIAMECNMIKLICRPDQDAVAVLKEYIEREQK